MTGPLSDEDDPKLAKASVRTGGTIKPTAPDYFTRFERRITAYIAAKAEHEDMLERIGPLDAPFPLPRS